MVYTPFLERKKGLPPPPHQTVTTDPFSTSKRAY